MYAFYNTKSAASYSSEDKLIVLEESVVISVIN